MSIRKGFETMVTVLARLGTRRGAFSFLTAVSLLFFNITPAMAQVGPAPTVSGGLIDNSGLIPFDQAFFAFEVESPLGSLKGVPIWDEIEQMLDDPYAFALDPTVQGNFQGWPSYRLTQERRRSFIFRNAAGEPCAPLSAGCAEVPLERQLIHPLNYNHSTGEELRLLNIEYEGGPWQVEYQLLPVPGQPGTYQYTYRDIEVSPGELRVEDDEAAADFNTPIAPDTAACIISVDAFYSPGPHPYSPDTIATGEGATICGGDPGEPGYLGFGVLGPTTGPPSGRITVQYSTPAFPLSGNPRNPSRDITSGPGSPLGTGNKRLFDPVRGLINARADGSATGGLRKPSVRITDLDLGVNGTPAAPDYLVNSAANLIADPAALLPSNENDYYRGVTRAQKVAARNEAAALGKAFFWEMQVGSDSVQACASCHFHAGADNRTKAQLNTNTAGGDLTSFEVEGAGGVTLGPNGEVVRESFPFHKLFDPTVSTDPLVNPGNIERTTNDVLSSMGVSRFQRFDDIPAIGTFLPAGASGVASLPPDIGIIEPDPVPANEGLRRIEPRHTPTFFAAALNFDNFWDGRARHDANGGSVFGPSDPQSHVMVDNNGTLEATRQIIRFVSLASLATGPALSEFEMSFLGRNWAKLGKKLLQSGVTPLANQLVDPTDSVMGLYSNQGGSACAGLPAADLSGPGGTAVGKPGLCISYPGLIRRAFYPTLWQNTGWHLNGCYTDGLAFHLNQCAPGSVAIPVLSGGVVVDSTVDPFDNYVLSIAPGAAAVADTNQFTQMEANLPLFFGLSIQAWGNILIPDDTPFDRFMDGNPDNFATFGESGEPGIAIDLLNCFGENSTGGVQPCFTEVGNFKRDPGVIARTNCTVEGTALDACTEVPSGGTRAPGSVDSLLGLDFFLGSNMSLKNPRFRSLRCGECHAGGTLTDHTFEISHQVGFGDRINEFFPGSPGHELFPEALGRGRVISGFLLEGELQENAQDGIERNVADFCTIEPCTTDPAHTPAGAFPQGQALFDNGVYNIGVTPIANDVSRGGNDPFGWPLSLGYLAFKNLCGVDYTPGGDNPATGFAQPPPPGNLCPTFDPSIDPTGGGLFEPTSQDQQINPGFAEEPEFPLLPPHLYPWASNIPVGDESNIDELVVGINTLMEEPMLEGFVDSWGPFNPAAIIGETFNNARQPEMAMWPNVNRVNAQGSFKAAPLRNIELTNPYFHNGGNLTLREQLDFYTRGGNFPITNSAHRDFLIMNLRLDDEALGGFINPETGGSVPPGTLGSVPEFTDAQKEEIIVAVVDFLLELTDERVAFQRAPFDQPEIFVPIDGTAPENGSLAGPVVGGREGFLNNLETAPFAHDNMFRQVPATGAGGTATKLPNFLGISSGPRLVGAAADCGPAANNHYCH